MPHPKVMTCFELAFYSRWEEEVSYLRLASKSIGKRSCSFLDTVRGHNISGYTQQLRVSTAGTWKTL
jgi:hypothetical protein